MTEMHHIQNWQFNTFSINIYGKIHQNERDGRFYLAVTIPGNSMNGANKHRIIDLLISSQGFFFCSNTSGL